MNRFGLEFHHFGLAVRDPAQSFTYLAGLGYREGAACFDAQQRVNLAMHQYPDCYTTGQLRTLQRRLEIWRHAAVQRRICEMHRPTQDIGSGAS
jgi:hypothetical protein